MPTRYTSEWTNNITILASTAVASGGNRTDNVDFAAGGVNYLQTVLQIKVAALSGSPSGNMTFEFFRSVNTTTDIDTIPAMTITIPFSGTATKVITIPMANIPWLQIKTTNGIGVSADVQIKYSGLKEIGTAF